MAHAMNPIMMAFRIVGAAIEKDYIIEEHRPCRIPYETGKKEQDHGLVHGPHHGRSRVRSRSLLLCGVTLIMVCFDTP
jgi:hypothetical protein